jgi:hypothetical protein
LKYTKWSQLNAPSELRNFANNGAAAPVIQEHALPNRIPEKVAEFKVAM